MARAPRRPREIQRVAEAATEAIAGPAIVRRVDPRQADLFDLPFIPPCKPTLATRVPVGPRWQYEIKHDGYRAQCHVLVGRVRIHTKSGLDYASRLPGLGAELAALPVRSAVIDGEACMVGSDGVTDFFALHGALSRKNAPDAVLYAFDLLNADGEDLRPRPLVERRARLAELVAGAGPAIIMSEHFDEDGPALLKAACEMGLEGIIAKLRDAPYRSGYVESWIKVKCTKVEPFAVIGCDPVGKASLRSLRVARLVDGALVPAGSVGSGLTEQSAREIRAALDSNSPVVVDVEYRGWTPSGELRHGAIKRWHQG